MQKRNEVRRATILPTEVSTPWRDSPLDLIAADLSPRGMYLISEAMPSIGDFVICSFALQRDKPLLNMFSRVQRINWHRRRNDRYRPGFGVEFVKPEPEMRLMIRDAVRGLPPPIPSRRRENMFNISMTDPSEIFGAEYGVDWCADNRRLITPSHFGGAAAEQSSMSFVEQGITYYC